MFTGWAQSYIFSLEKYFLNETISPLMQRKQCKAVIAG